VEGAPFISFDSDQRQLSYMEDGTFCCWTISIVAAIIKTKKPPLKRFWKFNVSGCCKVFVRQPPFTDVSKWLLPIRLIWISYERLSFIFQKLSTNLPTIDINVAIKDTLCDEVVEHV
jgi:hypothetical protein